MSNLPAWNEGTAPNHLTQAKSTDRALLSDREPPDPCARLRLVEQRITLAQRARVDTPRTVHLLAVSKTVPPEGLRAAYACGQRAFAESYVQEALPKQKVLRDLEIEWHFIGPIQANKTRPLAEHFAWVHSIERLRVAERLNNQRPAALPALNVCIQINIDREPSKSGVLPEELSALAHAIAALPHLRLRGLMAIPRPTENIHEQMDSFQRVRLLLESLRAEGLELDTLSMGMSDDLESAVACGATWVRVGTAIFGERPSSG